MARRRIRRAQYFEVVGSEDNEEYKLIKKHFPDIRAYSNGFALVFVGSNQDIGYYMGMTRNDRYATIEEIMEARQKFIPNNIDVAAIIPIQKTTEGFDIHVYQVAKPKFMPIRDHEGTQIGIEKVGRSIITPFNMPQD